MALARLSDAGGAQDASPVPGCYELEVGRLTMPGAEPAAAHAWPPPGRIRLSAEAPSVAEGEAHYVNGMAVRPHHVPPRDPLYELGGWSYDEGVLEIFWNGGFSAVIIQARRRGGEWVGSAALRSDDGSRMPSASATLKPSSCR
jgi:hypothetical protein